MHTADLSEYLTPREFAFWPTPEAEHRMGVLMVVDNADGERYTRLCDPVWLDMFIKLDPVARREVGMPEAVMSPGVIPKWPDEWNESGAYYADYLTSLLAEVEGDFAAYRERYLEFLDGLTETEGGAA